MPGRRRIFIGLSSGGLGHASRVIALLPQLAQRYDVHVGARNIAGSLLRRAQQAEDLEITLHELPTVSYRFRPSGRLDVIRTMADGYGRIYRGNRVAHVMALLDRIGAEAVISDFDPFSAWAAHKSGRRYIYCAAAYFYSHYRDHFDTLGERRQAVVLSQLTNMFFPRREAATIVPTFRDARRTARGRPRVTKPASVISRTLLAADIEVHRHMVAYVGGAYHAGLLPHLRDLGVPVRVYGLGPREPDGNLRFRPFHPIRYAEDMATARALLTPGGHQSLSEILFLGKPALAVPLKGSWEQQLNASLFERLRPGAVVDADALTARHLRDLLESGDGNLAPERVGAGNDDVVATLVEELERA